ncbi:MAG TPA: hypothetical protein VK469_12175, partial [Candidatus Kapabacteria bacterium]|nr:hypothetical protein [Candidatus Kapabacteria bacterium]
TIVMILLFVAALYFAKYKKRKSGCCGGAAYEPAKTKKIATESTEDTEDTEVKEDNRHSKVHQGVLL